MSGFQFTQVAASSFKRASIASTLVLYSVAQLASGTPATAQAVTGNTAPVCEAKTKVIPPLPEDLDLSAYSIDPVNLAPACSDVDGDELTLTDVSAPGTLDPKYGIHIAQAPQPGESVVIGFVVSDGKGGTANSTLTIIQQ